MTAKMSINNIIHG